MIIEFSVENYRSFHGLQTLSLVCGSVRELPENHTVPANEPSLKILKSAVIYGANGSGKSNLVRAMNGFFNFILDSTDLKYEQPIFHSVADPFRLHPGSTELPTTFSIEFIALCGIRHIYSVSLDSSRIIREKLVFFPKKQEALLYSREHGKPIVYGSLLKGRKKSIESELLPNTLFLSKAANSNHPQLKKVYAFFRSGIQVVPRLAVSDPKSSMYTTQRIVHDRDGSIKNKITDFLIAADTGITGLTIRENDHDQEPSAGLPGERPILRQEVTRYLPTTSHAVSGNGEQVGAIEFDLKDESDGTIKMYALAGPIVDALENGSTIIIDELDSSLHPHISQYLFRLFHDPEVNPHGAQLVVTTHDTSLLVPELFRRDQIWFTEKGDNGATELYSLVEFDKNMVRSNTAFSNWYLQGRFGALPVIDDKIFSEKIQGKGAAHGS